MNQSLPKMEKSSRYFNGWLPVIVLSIAAFIFNTTEFVPIGLLPGIATSFKMDVAHTGFLVTGYAWVVTLMSLPLTILTAKMERKKLLIGLFLLFIGSHFLAGIAHNFATLMTARIGIACAHAVFWAITVPLAVRLSPDPLKRATALSLIVTGTSLATVLGVPIGTLIGQYVGWRVTFVIIGITAIVILLLLMALLPKLPSDKAGSFKSLPLLLKNPLLLGAYALTAILVAGHFVAYTYISPFMTEVGHFNDDMVVILLLVIGGAGILGSLLFSFKGARYPNGMLYLMIFGLLISLVGLRFAAFSTTTIILLGLVWGGSFALVGLVMQTKILDLAPNSSDIAIAIYSAIFNVGIGGGALAGSLVLTQLGTQYVGYVGALFIIIAALFFFIELKRRW